MPKKAALSPPVRTRSSSPAKSSRKHAPKKSPTEQKRIAAVIAGAEALYPNAHCELNFKNPFELLIATILSAQCTDVRVNLVTPSLFARFPDAYAMAEADSDEIERLIPR